MTGSVASLWQAYPELPARELIQIIRNTGDRFDNPDATYGYGIPSFARAYRVISSARQNHLSSGMNVYPNPATRLVRIDLPGSDQGEYILNFYDMNGRLLARESALLPGELALPGGLAPGLYLLEVVTDHKVYNTRLIIQ
jgi:hypothetical protein